MKKCTKCKKSKSLINFSKHKKIKDGLSCWCKICMKKYQQDNKEKIRQYQEKYREENKESLSKKTRKWYKDNKEKIRQYQEKYREEHKEQIKQYREENKRRNKKRNKIWYIKNQEKIRKKHKKYGRKRYHTDIEFKISCNLRTRINLSLKGKLKSLSTMFLIGCEIDYLMYHIQNRFKLGMNWDNHGRMGWHIDHIKPCAKFDLSKESEQQKCFNYKNLQPLWAEENMKKSDKY